MTPPPTPPAGGVGPPAPDPWRAVEALEAMAASSRRTGWRRLLPAALTGTTRRDAWHRTRARRVLAALLLGAAAWAAVATLAPRPLPTGAPVVVATRDLAVGALVAPGDLRVERRLASQLPAGALRTTADAVGQVTAVAVRANEVLTPERFRGPGQLGGPAAADLAVSVPLLDDGLLSFVHAGDTVTVLAPGTGAVVAARARVLSVDGPPVGVLGETGSGATGVVLALSEPEARAVAATTSGPTGVSGFVLALRPD